MKGPEKKGKLARITGNALVSRIIFGAAGAILFIVFWEYLLEPIARGFQGNPDLNIPTFSESLGALFSSFVDTGGTWNEYLMGDHLMLSLGRVLGGFAIAVAIAAPIGLLMGYIREFEHFLFPINELARPIPPLAWIPVAVLLMSGELKVMFICFLGAYFPILINTIHGVRSIDPVLYDAAKTLGASRWTIFFKVVVPAASGSMMTGIRIGLGIAWMTIVAAEMIGSSNGVGWYIAVTTFSMTRYDLALGAMMLIAFVGYAIFLMMEVGERRFLKWLGMF
ncbi:MAG: ABC transporter permease [Thermoplasmata archaeon]|nr:ABC transporter permease [Thermoplasmata archaeon]